MNAIDPATQLRLVIRVENKSIGPVHLYLPDPPYLLPRADGVLEVRFTHEPVPANVLVEVAETPPLQTLAPGEQLTREFSIALPIEPRYPYPLFKLGERPVTRELTHLRVVMGYLIGAVTRATGYFDGRTVSTATAPASAQAYFVAAEQPLSGSGQTHDWPLPSLPAATTPLIDVRCLAQPNTP